MAYRFGECRLDIDARRLFRGPREVHLSPKAFELLRLLIETRPRALAKADLLERVWPGVFVSDSSLTRVVNQIRSGLRDTAREPQVVRTVHGYGYAFVADVTEEPTPKRPSSTRSGGCWFVLGDREMPLSDGEHLVGREPDAGVQLASPKVSRRHARLTVAGMQATIEDLSSKNGTSVRGARISGPTPLEPGDEIGIGPFTLIFRAGFDARSTETEVVSNVRERFGRSSRRMRRSEAG